MEAGGEGEGMEDKTSRLLLCSSWAVQTMKRFSCSLRPLTKWEEEAMMPALVRGWVAAAGASLSSSVVTVGRHSWGCRQDPWLRALGSEPDR